MSQQSRYYGVLWHAFYQPDGIRTEAKIIDEDFALFLAQGLSRHYQTEPEAIRPTLQSWTDFGTLRRMFCLWIEISTMDKNGETYQVVKKCEEETRMCGRMLLEDYEFRLKGNKAGDQMIAQLRIDLFLDLCIGREVDLLVDGREWSNEHGQLARSRLVWWIRIDDQAAKLILRGAAKADLNRERSLIVNTTGDIISELGSKGIFFPSTTLTAFVITEQSTEDATGNRTYHSQGKTSKRCSVHHVATSSNLRKDRRERAPKIWRKRKSAQGKIALRTKPRNDKKAMFGSKTDSDDEDGSGSGNDMGGIPTPELEEIVAARELMQANR
jgi:hypothetical protein